MSRTDTIEYFTNVAAEVQSADAKDIAREALTVISELQRELQTARNINKHSNNGYWDDIEPGKKTFGPG